MPLVPDARYRHTNLVAQDWRRLAAFYQRVFGCTPVPPERDLQGEWLDRSAGLDGAHLRGVHLRLPGCGPEGPTLELFQYEPAVAQAEPVANRHGWGHLAFAVPDVEGALAAVVAEGGRTLGQVSSVEVPGAGRLTVVYARDPEGNLLELQRWG
jgi:catechol 2,3-dioxygenase-like lactoylglutathione lyase family enzyme